MGDLCQSALLMQEERGSFLKHNDSGEMANSRREEAKEWLGRAVVDMELKQENTIKDSSTTERSNTGQFVKATERK